MPASCQITSALVGLLAAFAAVGCTHMKKSDTARTGKEQLLISNAVDQSLSRVNFEPFSGKAVYVEEKYLDSVDKGYIVSSIRHRVSRAGGTLVAKVEDADVLLEIRSGGVGTDNADAFLGIPEITLPGMLTLPEVRFISRSNQTAVAKLGLVAYDARSMNILGSGGSTMAQSNDNNWFVLGVGPYQNGTLREELSTVRREPEPPAENQLPRHVAFSAPERRQASPADESGPLRLTGGEQNSSPLPSDD